MYTGTILSLTCDYTLHPSVDNISQTAVTWIVDGEAVDTSTDRISSNGATLSFSPLTTSDTGSYTCTVTITGSQAYGSMQGEKQSAKEYIYIRGIQLVLKTVLYSQLVHL